MTKIELTLNRIVPQRISFLYFFFSSHVLLFYHVQQVFLPHSSMQIIIIDFFL